MKHYINPPSLSTSFSEDAKNVKKRFLNILDMSNKKKGISIFILILMFAGVIGSAIACSSQNNNNSSVDNYTEKLYSYKNTYVGNNSAVGAIINTLNYTDLTIKNFELKTDSEPYGIIINYKVDSRANYRFIDFTGFEKNAAVMFSLIPNLSEIHIRIYDDYGDINEPETSFRSSYYNRENLNQRFGMEHFTQNTVKEAAETLDSFNIFISKVSDIKSQSDFYSQEQKNSIEKSKQIYSIIGDDCEIITNSGTQFFVTINNKVITNPYFKGLMNQIGLDITPLKGKKIEFLTYQINNFKTNNSTYYIFVFDGNKMILNKDIKTSKAEQDVIGTLWPIRDNQ